MLIKAGELYTPGSPPRSPRRPAILLIPGQKPQITPDNPQALLQRAKDYGPHQIIDRPDILILPPLINAHAHLDLYAIGPRPYPGSFAAWLAMVIQARRSPTYDPVASVQKGLADSQAAGIAAIGDIAGTPAAAQARLQHGYPGVSYLETLGFPHHRAIIAAKNTRQKIRQLNRTPNPDRVPCSRPREHVSSAPAPIPPLPPTSDPGLRTLDSGLSPHSSTQDTGHRTQDLFSPTLDPGLRTLDSGLSPHSSTQDPGHRTQDFPSIGIEPHAPYSTHALQYRRLNQPRGILRTTHLAETPEELQFLRSGSGPFRDLLQKLNRWDPAFIPPPGVTPIAWFASLVPGPWHDWTLVHCNYVTDEDIQIMAKHQATVVYCPIASEYFGHKNHRYRDMLQAGIRVILGTDSAVCQPASEANPADLWPALQRLHQRDAFDPDTLIRMATSDAAHALRLPFFSPYAWEHGATLVRFDPSPSNPLPPLLSALQIPQNATGMEPFNNLAHAVSI